MDQLLDTILIQYEQPPVNICSFFHFIIDLFIVKLVEV